MHPDELPFVVRRSRRISKMFAQVRPDGQYVLSIKTAIDALSALTNTASSFQLL